MFSRRALLSLVGLAASAATAEAATKKKPVKTAAKAPAKAHKTAKLSKPAGHLVKPKRTADAQSIGART